MVIERQNKTGAQQKNTIAGLIEKQAQERPNAPAITCNNETLSYTNFNQKANQIANYLLKLGVRNETLVAIAMPRSVEVLAAMVGILKAGGAFVPLDYTHPSERLLGILEDNAAPFLITCSDYADRFNGYPGTVILLDEEQLEIQQCSIQKADVVQLPNQLAYVIYTSGSTGKPKGVLVEQKSIINFTIWFAAFSQVQAGDRIDFSSNFIFDMSLTTSIVALMLGLHIVICAEDVKRDVREYINFLEKYQINVTKMTPSFFKVLWQQISDKNVALSALKKIVLGGENLRTIDCANWLNKYPNHFIFNEYGPTEATVAVLQFAVTKNNINSLPENVPLGRVDSGFNIQCIILDENLQEISDDRIGELCIGGIQVARGYLNAPEMTNKKFIEHPVFGRLYRTGDLCRYLPDGDIEYLGRVDEQVKIRGYRIDTQEIDTILSKHPSIKDAVVVAKENHLEEKQLIAYFVLKSGASVPEKNELRKFLKKYLPEYMMPLAFESVEEFPLNANGKLDKNALPNPTEIVDNPEDKPNTELEKKLASIWSEVLNIQTVNLSDNFFELGGHSLSAARVINRIEKNLGKIISLNEFYAAPTIPALADLIERANGADDSNLIVATSNEATIALSDFQFMFWVSYVFEPKVKKLNVFARRRIRGKLNVDLLKQAFELLFQKHQVLSSKIGTFFPTQNYQKQLVFRISDQDISNLKSEEQEKFLSNSLDEIINHYHWPKSSPLMMAKVYYLNDNMTELQVCMPHIVSDDASEEVLFSDLSYFYNALRDRLPIASFQNEPQYASYVLTEKEYLKRLNKDIQFWENYLSDVSLFDFPLNIIDFNCKNYSTYLDLPDECIKNIQLLAAKNQISYVDLLCAAIVISLKKYFYEEGKNKNLLLNIIRSTREYPIFEKMIGCFLRLDPVKINMEQNLDLLALAKQIRISQLEIAPYQHCSSMVKLACMAKKAWKNRYITKGAIKIFTQLYTKLFPKLKLSSKVLSMYPRLTTLRKRQTFLINLNLFNNFLSTQDLREQKLFGYSKVNLNIHQFDLSTIDNVLDICFLRDDAHHKNYLAISANLQPAFRKLLGNTIIEVMKSNTN